MLARLYVLMRDHFFVVLTRSLESELESESISPNLQKLESESNCLLLFIITTLLLIFSK